MVYKPTYNWGGPSCILGYIYLQNWAICRANVGKYCIHRAYGYGKSYGNCHNYRTEIEEYESTVVYRTLLFHNSCFLRTLGKNYSQLTPNFLSFYNSCLCFIVFPPYFSHLPVLFCNCVFYSCVFYN